MVAETPYSLTASSRAAAHVRHDSSRCVSWTYPLCAGHFKLKLARASDAPNALMGLDPTGRLASHHSLSGIKTHGTRTHLQGTRCPCSPIRSSRRSREGVEGRPRLQARRTGQATATRALCKRRICWVQKSSAVPTRRPISPGKSRLPLAARGARIRPGFSS